MDNIAKINEMWKFHISIIIQALIVCAVIWASSTLLDVLVTLWLIFTSGLAAFILTSPARNTYHETSMLVASILTRLVLMALFIFTHHYLMLLASILPLVTTIRQLFINTSGEL